MWSIKYCRPVASASGAPELQVEVLAREQERSGTALWPVLGTGVSVSKVGGFFARSAEANASPGNCSPSAARRSTMADIPLTAEQEAEAQRLYETLQQAFLDEARQTARLLASKDDRHLLGATEFDLRDR